MRPTTQDQSVPGVHASRIGLNVIIREVKIGDDASAFRTLNEEWIVRFFSLEEKGPGARKLAKPSFPDGVHLGKGRQVS